MIRFLIVLVLSIKLHSTSRLLQANPDSFNSRKNCVEECMNKCAKQLTSIDPPCPDLTQSCELDGCDCNAIFNTAKKVIATPCNENPPTNVYPCSSDDHCGYLQCCCRYGTRKCKNFIFKAPDQLICP
eukprot:431717_1